MTPEVLAIATFCCSTVSPFAFSWCFLFLQAGSNSMTADKDNNGGIRCGNCFAVQCSLLLPFPGVFLFLQAGSKSTTADDNDNTGNGHGNLLLHNGLFFSFFWCFLFLQAGSNLMTSDSHGNLLLFLLNSSLPCQNPPFLP